MKFKLISFVTIFLIILSSAESLESKGNKAGAVILTSAGGIALGTGIFFLIRNNIRDRNYGDSIISAVETFWDRSEKAFVNEDYISCIHYLNKVQSMRSDYKKYTSKRDRKRLFDIDSVDSFISRCRLLEDLGSSVAKIYNYSETFPEDEYELSQVDRNELVEKLQMYNEFIDSIESANQSQKETVRYGFRAPLQRMAKLDSLIKSTYNQAKQDFSLKCKFYYNRAYESGDTNELRKFVNNCDYYQVDKKWCIQARSILESVDSHRSQTVATGFKALAPLDSMRLQYDIAMKSGRIDLLEKYISRYSKGPFRRKLSKIDKAQNMLNSLEGNLKAQTQWNKSHPLFANCDTSKFSIVVKGLNGEIETVFVNEFNSLTGEFKKVKGVRFPAGVVIDYSYSPSILLFKGFIDCKSDVVRTENDGLYCYTFSGVNKTMELLNRLKQNVVKLLSQSSRIGVRETESIRSAAYIVRLRKNNSEYITFYGKENTTGKNGNVDFYDFYDIKSDGRKDIRLQNDFSPIIKLSVDDKSDTCYTCKFFELKQ